MRQSPELATMGASEAARRALETALIKAWEDIPDEIFLACVDSMPDRVAAVIAADGWHTKY